MEFQGMGRLTEGQYRSRVRHMYDGPAGAVLAVGSLLSLHEPLVGRIRPRTGEHVVQKQRPFAKQTHLSAGRIMLFDQSAADGQRQ